MLLNVQKHMAQLRDIIIEEDESFVVLEETGEPAVCRATNCHDCRFRFHDHDCAEYMLHWLFEESEEG